ncbi:MAG: phosphatase PAP2 family protein [Chitinophagaceae bacterium]|nr:phosphatase PAP2 family protein [Chitinophagaceae bacterium]MBP6588980.1 phosphatase PAP2 family protein [Chitinophagaceae bacterium]MBP8243114.1 phosphatase PAP2 family protein [Chitinophagaceae bacterium]
MEKKKDIPVKIIYRREPFLLSIVMLVPIILIWILFIDKNHYWDDQLLAQTGQLIHPDLTPWIKSITALGNHAFLIPAFILLIFVLLLLREKKEALQTLLIALSSLGLMSLFKNLFQRDRPDHPLVNGITNYSFPSGHAMMSIAFYGLLIWLLGRHLRQHKIQRSLVIGFLILLILLIGFSRIYLRVHYPSDVIAGYSFGIGWLWLSLRITSRIRVN